MERVVLHKLFYSPLNKKRKNKKKEEQEGVHKLLGLRNGSSSHKMTSVALKFVTGEILEPSISKAMDKMK